jgi:hypothetical protein
MKRKQRKTKWVMHRRRAYYTVCGLYVRGNGGVQARENLSTHHWSRVTCKECLTEHPDAVRARAKARAEAPSPGDTHMLFADDRNEGQFSVAEDGHYVSDDGWVVPKNFDEFYDRYPKYILNWVTKRLNRFAVDEDVEDWAQDFLIYLKFSPARFFNRGETDEACRDVIEAFDPYEQGGASELSFRKYLNAVLACLFEAVAAKRPGHDVPPILGEETKANI